MESPKEEVPVSSRGDNHSHHSSDEDIDAVYYFESDHLALKGNRDYGILLKAITMLESQRIKAIEDVDQLHSDQQAALDDPIRFVDKLQHGADMGLPKPQNVPMLPSINWDHYTSNANLAHIGLHKHMTRLKKNVTENSPATSNSSETGTGLLPADLEMENKGPIVIRGRVKDEKKSSTFNQLWTVDEQRRLEELLLLYPPEEVEAKRWQKIATALGNRTLQQVASRVQKYFIKLAKSGLPVPGRVPNLSAHNKKSAHRHHRYQKFYYQSSTMMSSYEPPVYMSDEDESYSMYGENSVDMDTMDSYADTTDDPNISEDENIPEALRDTEDYQELLKLKKLKRQKMEYQGACTTRHVGFKCDQCSVDPIVGVRWHCLDCPTDNSVDFCDECVDSSFDVGTHNSSHRLEPIRKVVLPMHIDQDYVRFTHGDYNYLDPNYMPAS